MIRDICTETKSNSIEAPAETKPELRIGILKNESPRSAERWAEACKRKNLTFQIIDLSSAFWLEQVLSERCDLYLLHPSGSYEQFKTMYDERIHIICNELHLRTYPSYNECIIYENKKMLAYFLASRSIPHPATHVFYDFEETAAFLACANFPIVAKTSIGASGAGVRILKSQSEALSYIDKAFKGRGISRRFGPNRVTGNPGKWIVKTICSPSYFVNRMKLYFEINRNTQKGYVIFQEYVQHDFEWRIVKIGNSYFTHKKIKVVDKASGGKVKQFGLPDNKVLDFVDEFCAENHLSSVCVDIFESDRGFLVNEIQCIFGIPYGYLMKVGNETGRIRKMNGAWQFESGDFTFNECFDLRLEHAISLLQT